MHTPHPNFNKRTSDFVNATNSPRFRYAIISPARDEEAFAAKTIESISSQTVLPYRWIIVDDGSTDRTAEIAESYAQKFPWIHVEQIRREKGRNPGPGVVAAFNAGLSTLSGADYDFIVKLDMDLILPADYFETLLSRFETDGSLGIASGVYLEYWKDQWLPVPMPEYHAAGASKVMRRACFEAIGGFCPTIGWDSIDEIRARHLGWNTCHFQDLQFRHLRHEGQGVGPLRTWKRNGVAYYLMGGGLFFLLFKIPYRMIASRPRFLGGVMLLWGFLSCLFIGRERLVSKDESRLYRKLLRSQLWNRWKKMPSRNTPPRARLDSQT